MDLVVTKNRVDDIRLNKNNELREPSERTFQIKVEDKQVFRPFGAVNHLEAV
jgi:hypothetical protein